MPADMKTIAERVGVSKTTVHRALANVGRISPETREKILKVAAELDYRPNNLARGLRSQKSATIGFVVIGLTNSFYSTILEGVESISTDSGYSILVARTEGRMSREIQHLDVLREKRVDGIIIAPSHPTDNAEYYEKLRQIGIPFVFIDRYVESVDADYVMTDNFLGGYLAGKHLVSLGRRRIGFGCIPGSEMKATSVSDRIRGLAAAMEEVGLGAPAMVGEGLPGFKPQEGFAAASVERYLRDGGELDGVFACNDNTAIGIVTGLKRMGLSVPGDVSVVGFDDLDIAPYVQPALTTIRQPARTLGEEAIRLLLKRMSAGQRGPYQRLSLPPQLVIRESCGGRSEDGN